MGSSEAPVRGWVEVGDGGRTGGSLGPVAPNLQHYPEVLKQVKEGVHVCLDFCWVLVLGTLPLQGQTTHGL